MAREDIALLAFNRGLISKLALARIDLKRTSMSAETQTNWLPRVLGAMMLRPGMGQVSPLPLISQTYNNKKAYHLNFIFDKDDTAIIELTDGNMRVRVDEVPITRPAVTAVVANGAFAGNITGWTNADQAGAMSAYQAPNMMSFIGTRYNAAAEYQKITVNEPGTEHGIRIVVARGPVSVIAGSTVGTDDVINEIELATGVHSLSIIPTGDFYLQFSGRQEYTTLLSSVQIEAAGVMLIPTPWPEADLQFIRNDESASNIYVTCTTSIPQYIIQRRTVRSWSLIGFETNDGPFGNDNTDTTLLTPSALSGNITIAADRPTFKATNVGSLYRITSIGQNVALTLGGNGQFTDPIRVSGVGASRLFNYTVAGTWTGTLTLQQSVGDAVSWTNVTAIPADTTASLNDGFDNQIVYYRIGFIAPNYGSGSANVTLTYANGGLTGIARVTGFNNTQSVNAIVLTPFGATTPSELWAEGDWSPRRGYPSAVAISEGRMWFAGKAKVWGSVSDAYQSFDDTTIGDSGPINRSIGSGPVDNINFILALTRLILGGEEAEFSCRSSSLDEPLTPSNFNLKAPSTEGSAAVDAIHLDNRGMFVQRGGTKLFQLDNVRDAYFQNFQSTDLSQLTPELCQSGIVRLAVQRQIDTRIHCVLGDGTAAILVNDTVENVLCWILFETDGVIEDVIIQRGDIEDSVYYTVARQINGQTVRNFEKFATINDCSGGTYIYDDTAADIPVAKAVYIKLPYLDGTKLTARAEDGTKIGNYVVSGGAITLPAAVTYAAFTPTLFKLADSFLLYSGVSTNTITGLSTLEGREVVCWADGKDMGGLDRLTFTVTGGQIVLPEAVTDAVVGLYYEARFKSSKLEDAAGQGNPLNLKKKQDHLGVIMNSTHYQGLRYGTDFEQDDAGNYLHLDDLPQTENEEITRADMIWNDYDDKPFEFDGTWDSDSRLCLLAQAPRPCILLACTADINVNG